MFLKYNWPGIAWAIVILILTGIPGNYIPKVETFWSWLKPDKLIHLAIFIVFVFLLLRGFKKQSSFRHLQSYYIIYALIFGTFFGLITEVLQKFVFIGRHASIYDFIADTLGCVIGFILFRYLNGKFGGKIGNLLNLLIF